MIRVVADSNVYVSALNFGGVADEVLALGRRQAVMLFVSPSILDEVERVLVRKFEWSPKRARQARTLLRAFARTIVPKEKLAVVSTDETDNRILEAAVAAEAQLLVTGDNHLLAPGKFRGIAIVSPRQFLDARAWEGG